ncbi:MAG: hypothetical protein IPM13_18580 [Phycisphaerales bacterium]|nr:hypothetical protein [Phycisphaerales bacterium]
MSPRSLPFPPWFLAVLIGLVAATLTGCDSDRHHRRDDRDAPRGPVESHPGQARPQGQQPQGGWGGNMEHGRGGPESHREGPPPGPQGQGHDPHGPGDRDAGSHDSGNQGRQPESLLHRLEMGREAAREIGDREAAEAMQRAVERTRRDRGPRDHERPRDHEQQGEPRDGDRQRLDQLERRIEELMRAVEELRRDRRDRKAV